MSRPAETEATGRELLSNRRHLVLLAVRYSLFLALAIWLAACTRDGVAADAAIVPTDPAGHRRLDGGGGTLLDVQRG